MFQWLRITHGSHEAATVSIPRTFLYGFVNVQATINTGGHQQVIIATPMSLSTVYIGYYGWGTTNVAVNKYIYCIGV